MELEGAKRCFREISDAGLKVETFVSDRHRGIAKWIKGDHPDTNHFFDLWHVARGLSKKLLKASKEKDCEIIKDWMTGIRNHLYWSVLSTKQGFENLIVAKWKSFMDHIRNVHSNFGDPLFPQCCHSAIKNRKWIKLGTLYILLAIAL